MNRVRRVIIGTSPFMDTSIVVGPFLSTAREQEADELLTSQGWNTEVCDLLSVLDAPTVDNEEGA